VERLWLAADRIAPPFVNQLVLEGRAAWSDEDLDRDRAVWEEALRSAAGAVPGLSLRLLGRLGATRWIEGPPPRLRHVDGRDWDGNCGDGAPFLRDALDAASGPVCELLRVRGDPARLVLRSHHAATDGRGTLSFAEALFAALRGEVPTPVDWVPDIDLDLARASGRSAESRVADDCSPPVPGPWDTLEGPCWQRRRVEPVPDSVLPRVLDALMARAPGGRCDVSVDLRPLAPGLRSTANLAGIVRLPCPPEPAAASDRSERIAALAQRLDDTRSSHQAADFVLASAPLRSIPLALLSRLGASAARRNAGRLRFATSATVSNLGRLDTALLSAPSFTTRRGFFIPPGSPGLPLFVALSGDEGGVEICATMPRALASQGRIEALVDALAGALHSA
jgi:hypothetical protein